MSDQSPEWLEYKKSGYKELLKKYKYYRSEIELLIYKYAKSISPDTETDQLVRDLLLIQVIDPVDPEIRDNFKSGNPLEYCQSCGRAMGKDVIMKGFYFNKAMIGISYLETYLCVHCVKDIDMAVCGKSFSPFSGKAPIQHLSFWRKLWNLLTE